MQKETTSRNAVISARLSDMTRKQLKELTAQCGFSVADVITTAIDRMYQQEIKTMTSPTYFVNAEMLGDTATDADAHLMVLFLHNRDYNVAYGEPRRGQNENEIAVDDWQAGLKHISLIKAQPFGFAIHEGAEYTLTSVADFSSRLFDGNGLNAQEGEPYTVEFTCPAIDNEGNRYEIYWQFDGIIKGQEPAPDGYPFDDDHITRVIAQ